jgi:endonuclease/exonuclease/phosphatase family metal-dependent hydrolase
MTTTPVPFYEYVETSDDWRPYSRTVYPKTGDNVSVRGLTLMTWNVWYEPMEENLRHREIFNRIHQAAEEVDVIALQEVTPRFLAELQYEKFVRRQWLITNRWDDAHRKALRENGYGIMFLVNRALEVSVESSVAPFPTSKPGRYGQLLEIKGIHVLVQLL